MPIHDPQLVSGPRPGDGALGQRRRIVPQPHRHVVAPAHQDITRMWAPRQPPHGIFVALHQRQRPAGWVSNVKGAQEPVHAARGHNRVVVFVPVVREDLCRRAAGCYARIDARLGRCGVDRDG